MFIAIDTGATKTAVALFQSKAPESQINMVEFPTTGNYQEYIDQVTARINELTPKTLQGIGVSLALKISESGQILTTSNLPDFYHHTPITDLETRFGVPVALDNDAVCAAQAELHLSHPECARLLHLIIGTGFGGAFLMRSQGSLVAIPMEPGSTIIHPEGKDHTHNHLKGTVEAYISGSQIEAQLRMNLKDISDNHPIWTEVETYLSIEVFNLIQLFHPDKITFSGGVVNNRPFLLHHLQDALYQYPTDTQLPSLSLSSLKSPCLLGALMLLK